jgi:membrane fusion protein (multidrug efflux system)
MKLIPLILLVGIAAGCSRHNSASPAEALPAVTVSTAVVEAVDRPQTRVVAGMVRPLERAAVAARVMGTVATADLAVGQQVKAGEVLVRVNAGELSAQLEQARAAVGQAERDYAREASLAEKGAAAAESVRFAADQLRLARARLAEAQAMVGYTQVAAPFDGVITEDWINAGDLAAPGQPLFTLEGTSDLRAEVPVPESLASIAIGTAIAVQIDGQTLAGTLVELSPSADAMSRTRLAKISLPASAGVRSGQFVRALWPLGPATMISAPQSAVQTFGQMERVFVVVNGRAQLRIVRTGAALGPSVQILSGLEAGESVVLNPPAHLRDGQPLMSQP